MSHGRYRSVTRPAGSAFPVLVFDTQDRLHLPLTLYSQWLLGSVERSTLFTYLTALLPFFTFLEQSPEPACAWDSPPALVRQAVAQYLIDGLQCKVRLHAQGFELVATTAHTRGSVRMFLSSLKAFYRCMDQQQRYAFANPLLEVPLPSRSRDRCSDDPPSMPPLSGIVPARRPRQRLTDSYFKLVDQLWVPQVLDDPTLPARILEGGQRLPGWGLRETCVTRLLFETGGRISEIVGLTLGDWHQRGCLQEAAAFSKGSSGKRVKFLRFSRDTAILLRQYVDQDRRRLDPTHWTLDRYQRQAEPLDLSSVPLFLSHQRTPYTAKTYREHAWNPACRQAGIEANVHQARHWYVTLAVRAIYEQEPTSAAIERRLRELIAYMGWASGQETLAAYEHYLDAARHAEIQDTLHARLEAALTEGLRERLRRGGSDLQETTAPLGAVDAEFAFLVGTGSI